MPTCETPRWKVALLLALLVAVLLLGYALRTVFTPVLLAFALAYLLNPAVSGLERLGIGRTASILLLYAFVFLASGGLLVLIAPPVTVQVRDLYVMTFKGEPYGDLNNNGVYDRGEPLLNDINKNGVRDRSYLERASGFARRALKKWNDDHPEQAIKPDLLLKKLRDAAESNLERVTGGMAWAADRLVGLVASGLHGLLVVLSFVLLVPLYLFGFLKYFGRIHPAVLHVCPSGERDRLERVLRRIDAALVGFFRGQVLIGLVKGILVAAALVILGTPYGLLLGILYGVMSIVPYGGVLAVFPLIEIVTVIDAGGLDLYRVVGAVVVAGIAETVEGAILVPLLYGRRTGLHPLVLLVSLFVFGQLFGLFGILAAVPLTATAKILIEEYLLPIVHDVADGPALPLPAGAPPPPGPGAPGATPS